jgi:site-specific DNA-methyltransferase (adenine-specific)
LIISHGDGFGSGERVTTYGNGFSGSRHGGTTTTGRWPANLIHDGSDEVVGLFPEAGGGFGKRGGRKDAVVGDYGMKGTMEDVGYGDTGSAARFFYCAKADASERRNSKHPTVKPLALMRYLCRLVCPPGGIVLDPFCGSGTTLEAARLEGFQAIGCELNAEYIADCKERLKQGVLF